MARPATGQVVERSRKDGRRAFAIRFRAYGKRHYVTTSATSQEEAERELRHVLADVERGAWRPPRSEPALEVPKECPIFWAFAEGWFQRHALEVKERTREHWLWVLDVHLREGFGRYPLDAIDAELVDSYKAERLRSGLSAESVNKTLRLLARILDEALEYGHVERNPARGKNRRLRVKTARRLWLELDEVRSLLEAAGDYRRELTTQVFAGLRISELGSLRWRAIDFGRGRLEVEESKTEAGEGRRIDLAPVLLEELKRHWAEHPTAGLDDLVFRTSKGYQRDRSNSRGRLATIVKRANEARTRAELAPIKHVTNHTLRRTFASLMYEAGA